MLSFAFSFRSLSLKPASAASFSAAFADARAAPAAAFVFSKPGNALAFMASAASLLRYRESTGLAFHRSGAARKFLMFFAYPSLLTRIFFLAMEASCQATVLKGALAASSFMAALYLANCSSIFAGGRGRKIKRPTARIRKPSHMAQEPSFFHKPEMSPL